MCWFWLPGPPWAPLATVVRPGQSRTGPKVPQGVWEEILSLALTPGPARAPKMYIFIPSYVPGTVAPQISAPWVTSRLGSEGKTRVTGHCYQEGTFCHHDDDGPAKHPKGQLYSQTPLPRGCQN